MVCTGAALSAPFSFNAGIAALLVVSASSGAACAPRCSLSTAGVTSASGRDARRAWSYEDLDDIGDIPFESLGHCHEGSASRGCLHFAALRTRAAHVVTLGSIRVGQMRHMLLPAPCQDPEQVFMYAGPCRSEDDALHGSPPSQVHGQRMDQTEPEDFQAAPNLPWIFVQKRRNRRE